MFIPHNRRHLPALALCGALLHTAACGAPADHGPGGSRDKIILPQTKAVSGAEPEEAALAVQGEQAWLTDNDCPRTASPFFRNAMEDSLARFNAIFPPEGDIARVGFLDSAGEIRKSAALLASCRRGNAEAFTQGKTVVVSVELMALLWDSAQDLTIPSSGAREEIFNSALAFIIYHELGHVFLGHSSSRIETFSLASRRLDKEIEADLFAAEAHGRAGYSADGPRLVFGLLEKINPEGSLDHPGSRFRSSVILSIHQAGKL